MQFPEHVCALLTDERGWMVLQLRPRGARHAASQMTCFGGKREADEAVKDCLRRELHEETGWFPPAVGDAGIDLRCGQRFIARFIPLLLPRGTCIRPESGFITVRCAIRTLPAMPLSPWHQAVINGWLAGDSVVEI